MTDFLHHLTFLNEVKASQRVPVFIWPFKRGALSQQAEVNIFRLWKRGIIIKAMTVLNLRATRLKFFKPHKTYAVKFLGNKTLDQRLGANSKKQFFAKFYSKFASFLCFFIFLAQKNAENDYLTSIRGAQHPYFTWLIN